MQRTESIEVKTTLVGSDMVGQAVDSLGLKDGKDWRIVFCEDVTQGVDAATPLLDLGVVLRVRGKGKKKGDSTIKLRPSRWSQLAEPFRTNLELGDHELKIEADWSASGHVLAASLTADWEDGRLADVESGDLPVTALLTDMQRKFLAECSRERVDLASVTALGAIPATRWDEFSAQQDDVDLSVRPERWQVGDLDFLELSIVSTLEAAAAEQAALDAFVTAQGLTADAAAQNKTQRVVSALVTARLTTPA